jgi:osmoprotectant transport system permease protein
MGANRQVERRVAMKSTWLGLALLASAACIPAAVPAGERSLVVASKKFTESVVLGEVASIAIRAAGVECEHRRELGGTRVLWNALRRGDLDLYPEYTGTIRAELLRAGDAGTDVQLAARLADLGVGMTPSLGFDDTYALGMRRDRAAALGIRTLGDLRRHAELRCAFTNEFMDRADGWPGLRERYRLPQAGVRGLDHDLAYRALAAGEIDVTDLYSTDAEIAEYDLAVLEDDLHYFPEYRAVFLYRIELERIAPQAVAALRGLGGALDATAMRGMNARVKISGESEARVAADFFSSARGTETVVEVDRFWTRLARRTREHVLLVGLALAGGIVTAVPLGILAALRPGAGRLILGAAGIVQTIPALALLVFMIPPLGIYAPPAVAALYLYSLLPIIRNTSAGLRAIPPPIRESAAALGLGTRERLLWIDLPMASGAILAGIQTSAVITVGFATLGALVGAGGYGQPILTGIRLDDYGLILEGAVPAALLAILVQIVFDLVERRAVPRGLRPRPER